MPEIPQLVTAAARQKILYTSHALNEMNAPDELITKNEVREVIERGELIENYPDDQRGQSCLLAAHTTKNRMIHVVCAPKSDYLAIITAYVPTQELWEKDLKTRKRRI